MGGGRSYLKLEYHHFILPGSYFYYSCLKLECTYQILSQYSTRTRSSDRSDDFYLLNRL